MTPEEQAIVTRCAFAICWYCGHPDYTPAEEDVDGNWYHRQLKGKKEDVWCEANLIWGEFSTEEQAVEVPA